MYRQVGTEYLNAVTLLTFNVSDINHAYVHTDITHVIGFLSVHKAISLAITKVTVQTIGITKAEVNRDLRPLR